MPICVVARSDFLSVFDFPPRKIQLVLVPLCRLAVLNHLTLTPSSSCHRKASSASLDEGTVTMRASHIRVLKC